MVRGFVSDGGDSGGLWCVKVCVVRGGLEAGWAAVGGEGRVPPGRLPVEVAFEGVAQAWVGRYRVLKG